MRNITVNGNAPNHTPDQVYPILSRFEEYTNHSPVVRKVNLLEHAGTRSVSTWEVNFRQGILKWTEEDIYTPENYHISFRQLEGDAEHFQGQWQITADGEGCSILFEAEFDMGIPSMSDIIEPIAEQALRENIKTILSGMLDGQIEFNH